jgi:hypothetical protein
VPVPTRGDGLGATGERTRLSNSTAEKIAQTAKRLVNRILNEDGGFLPTIC